MAAQGSGPTARVVVIVAVNDLLQALVHKSKRTRPPTEATHQSVRRPVESGRLMMRNDGSVESVTSCRAGLGMKTIGTGWTAGPG